MLLQIQLLKKYTFLEPEFGENALLNLNITIYYPVNSKTWNISNFDPLGAKDIRFVPWNPEEKEKEKDKDKTLLFIIIVIGIVIIIGIIIFIVIRKKGAKTSNDIESIKGELISE